MFDLSNMRFLLYVAVALLRGAGGLRSIRRLGGLDRFGRISGLRGFRRRLRRNAVDVIHLTLLGCGDKHFLAVVAQLQTLCRIPTKLQGSGLGSVIIDHKQIHGLHSIRAHVDIAAVGINGIVNGDL